MPPERLPRNHGARPPAEIAPTLSWAGRYLIRCGGGPEHPGALTLWTTRIDVDRKAFPRGLIAAIADARPADDPRSIA
jgi:hypothetical protein